MCEGNSWKDMVYQLLESSFNTSPLINQMNLAASIISTSPNLSLSCSNFRSLSIPSSFMSSYCFYSNLWKVSADTLPLSTFYSNDLTLQVRIKRNLLLISNQIPMSCLKKIPNIPDCSLADLEGTMRKFIVRSNPFFSSEAVRSRFLEFLDSE